VRISARHPGASPAGRIPSLSSRRDAAPSSPLTAG
jgi:hypothetical protein